MFSVDRQFRTPGIPSATKACQILTRVTWLPQTWFMHCRWGAARSILGVQARWLTRSLAVGPMADWHAGQADFHSRSLSLDGLPIGSWKAMAYRPDTLRRASITIQAPNK